MDVEDGAVSIAKYVPESVLAELIEADAQGPAGITSKKARMATTKVQWPCHYYHYFSYNVHTFAKMGCRIA